VMTFGGIRSEMASGGKDLVGMALVLLGAGVLIVLCLAIPLILAGVNQHFRGISNIASTAHPGASDEAASPIVQPVATGEPEPGNDQHSPPAPFR
jgi:hypothetical protein